MTIVEELRAKVSRDNRELLDRAAEEIEDLDRKLAAAYKKIEEMEKQLPPCKVGDIAYCIISKGGLSGGLIFTGHIIKRRVDKLIFDGSRWEMMSERVYPDYKDGNGLIYAYFDDLAFVDEGKAKARLEEILDVGRRHDPDEQN